MQGSLGTFDDRLGGEVAHEGSEPTRGGLTSIAIAAVAGYITIEKTFDGRKPRIWISATKAGRKALKQEIAALREIIGSVDGQSGVGGAPGSAPIAGI